MARTRVDCATEGCEGHCHVEARSRRDADYRAKKLAERGWTCRDCDNREAAARAEAAGLPTLEGSEKQVAWAITLREPIMSHIDAMVPGAVDMLRSGPERLHCLSTTVQQWTHELATLMHRTSEAAVREAIEAIRSETDARFWIDGRNETLPKLVAAAVERLAEEARAMSPEGKAAAAAEQEAMEEATLRPAEPVSETIAELAFRDGRLVARYDERSDTFNAAVKGLGYLWDPAAQAWTRRHAELTMGDPLDRLAETAHELLAAGIVVALHDPAARAKAVDRSYEPEHTRWISLVTAGEHQGKFRITWGRGEDLYREFRGLRGATYRDKACLVPATSRDEVLDFAAAHGFRLTPGAEARAAEVLAQRERGTVVEAKARPKVETERRGDAPGRLDVPSDVTVDDDLVDND
ncbi:hypothetical protein [Methylorubrum extorquens]|jgi:hypothetical protein|uniref:Uncharacterized protein n=1 Tax=Methylorubrum extorquens DSM 13060 TaxID=882800 RepID=H1KS24_METEX|nr:hypothetical protein [Methylorubrum extorquens]EHP89591.1 hypothetical protein MetexDRAFT_5437 [Methylorubrum extorquens DSM 13060]